MLYLITATNADGSYRQWAERIDPNPKFPEMPPGIAALLNDQHRKNPGHGNHFINRPMYLVTPL